MIGTVLVVHSSGPQGPGEGSEPLVRRLRGELGGEFEVLFPVMPGTEDEPHYEPWRDRLSAEFDALEGKVIVFGHSLGGSVALKYCAELGFDAKVAGLVTAAAPYWGTTDWEEEWALPESWPAKGPRLPPSRLLPQLRRRGNPVLEPRALRGAAAGRHDPAARRKRASLREGRPLRDRRRDQVALAPTAPEAVRGRERGGQLRHCRLAYAVEAALGESYV